MEPTFTHSCHHDRKTNCAGCAQQSVQSSSLLDHIAGERIKRSVAVQEEALKQELLVMYLREDHGPQTVHAILSGTPRGLEIYKQIATRAEGIR